MVTPPGVMTWSRTAREVGFIGNLDPLPPLRWRNRFLDGGSAALDKDAPRPGRPSTITPAKIQDVVRKTTQEKPSNLRVAS